MNATAAFWFALMFLAWWPCLTAIQEVRREKRGRK